MAGFDSGHFCKPKGMRNRLSFLFFIISIFVLLPGCSTQPQPINYGIDECVHCKMKITEQKFGAEIITKKGKALKFDSGECMINYTKENSAAHETFDKYLVIDYAHSSQLIDATTATWLSGEAINSPMGGNIAAFDTKESALKNNSEISGQVLTWDEVIKLDL